MRIAEEWLSAQLYGSLYSEFESRTQYEVYIEYPLNHRTRSQADLYVENTGEGDDFLVEVKHAEELENGEEVKRQPQKYFRDIDDRRDLALDKAFLCIIGGTTPEYGPEETESMDLSEFVNIPLYLR